MEDEKEKVLLLRHGSFIFFYLIEDLMNHAQQTAKQGGEKSCMLIILVTYCFRCESHCD